jgi:hypothetical protein
VWRCAARFAGWQRIQAACHFKTIRRGAPRNHPKPFIIQRFQAAFSPPDSPATSPHHERARTHNQLRRPGDYANYGPGLRLIRQAERRSVFQVFPAQPELISNPP